MKTPRDILLERHRAAGPKLDAIRRGVVAGEFDRQETKEPSEGLLAWLLRCFTAPWRELILPSRRIWTGLATVWVLIFIINLSQRDTISSVTGKPVHAPAMVMSFQYQQRLMNELLADRLTPPDADRPRNAVPKPRTEKEEITAA